MVRNMGRLVLAGLEDPFQDGFFTDMPGTLWLLGLSLFMWHLTFWGSHRAWASHGRWSWGRYFFYWECHPRGRKRKLPHQLGTTPPNWYSILSAIFYWSKQSLGLSYRLCLLMGHSNVTLQKSTWDIAVAVFGKCNSLHSSHAKTQTTRSSTIWLSPTPWFLAVSPRWWHSFS